MERAPDAESRAIYASVLHLHARAGSGERWRATLHPAPDSPLSADIRAGIGDDLLTHGLTWMLSADSHLLTLASAFSTGQVHPFGPYSLLRGAAEPMARLTWLLDQNVSSEVRHQRLLAERLENQLERRKLKAMRVHAEERIEHISRRAVAAGFTATVNPKNGLPVHFGQARPPATQLFNDVLVEAGFDTQEDPFGELLYRLLSGHAHSAMFALMSQTASTEATSDTTRLARIELHTFTFMAVLDAVLRMHDVAQLRWAGMHGADDRAWLTVRAGLPPTADLTAYSRQAHDAVDEGP